MPSFCGAFTSVVLLGAALLVALATRPAQPVDPARITTDGGRFVQLPDGRVLEYFVVGSQQPNATILLEFPGFGTTAHIQTTTYTKQSYASLNIRAICVTLPGFGYSSVQLGRQLRDWHLDVEHVLAQERVDRFVVAGHSLGTPHAMQVAHHYGSPRVRALLMTVPLAPDPFRFADPSRVLPSFMVQGYAADVLWYLVAGSKLLRMDPVIVAEMQGAASETAELLLADLDRSVVHTHHGWGENMRLIYGWGETSSHNDWGFTPREIDVENVVIAYAMDDEVNRKENAEWLAKEIPNAQTVSIDIGKGHFSYIFTKHDLYERILRMLE